MNLEPQSRRFLRRAIVASFILLILVGCGTRTPSDPEPIASPTRAAASAASATASLPTQTPLPSPTAIAASTSEPATGTATPTTEVLPSATPAPQAPATAIVPSATPSPAASPEPHPTQPPPTPAPTSPPPPQILSFTAAPTTTQNLGDKLRLAWQATGSEAAICPLLGSGPVELECQQVPLQGEMLLVTDEASMAYIGFALRVQGDGPTAWSAVNTHLQCQNLRQWFFDNPPERCPESPAFRSYAAGQYFERGFMIWVQDTDEFYIFYNGPDENGFQTFERLVGLQLQLKPDASQDNRIPEEPPPGYLQPVSGFGLLWRGEIENPVSDVRQRLGWATEPEFGYEAAYQCATRAHPRSWSCYLRGPRGEILYLHPDSTAQVRLLWETE